MGEHHSPPSETGLPDRTEAKAMTTLVSHRPGPIVNRFIAMCVILAVLTLSHLAPTTAFYPPKDIFQKLDGTNGFSVTGFFGAVRTLPIAVGDLDCDGLDDIVVVNLTSKAVFIIWGRTPQNGDASSFVFTTTDSTRAMRLDAGSQGEPGLAMAFSKKNPTTGCQDLVIGDAQADLASVIKGSPDFVKQSVATIAERAAFKFYEQNARDFPSSLSFVDLNNDGVEDVAAFTEGYVDIYVAASSAGFPQGVTYSTTSENLPNVKVLRIWLTGLIGGLTSLDFNGDGIQDLMFTDDNHLVTLYGGAHWDSKLTSGSVFTITTQDRLAQISGQFGIVADAPRTQSNAHLPFLDLSAAVDWNLDGIDDLLLGAQSSSARSLPALATIQLGQKSTTPIIGAETSCSITHPHFTSGGMTTYFLHNAAAGHIGGMSINNNDSQVHNFKVPVVMGGDERYNTPGLFMFFGSNRLVNIDDSMDPDLHSCQGYLLGPKDVGVGSAVGDVNGDGFADIIARSQSALYVAYGEPSIVPTIEPRKSLVYHKHATAATATANLNVLDITVQCTIVVVTIKNPKDGDALVVDGIDYVDAALVDGQYVFTFSPSAHDYHDAATRTRTLQFKSTATKSAAMFGDRTISVFYHPYGFADAKFTQSLDDLIITVSNELPVVKSTQTESTPVDAVTMTPAVIDAVVEITDSDDDNMVSAVVSIDDFDATLNDDDKLNCPTSALPADVTCDVADGELTLTGSATTAAYQSLLQSVTYSPQAKTSNYFSTTRGKDLLTRVITFTVNDGYDNSAPFPRTMAIDPTALLFTPFVEGSNGFCSSPQHPLAELTLPFGGYNIGSIAIKLNDAAEDAVLSIPLADEDITVGAYDADTGTLMLTGKKPLPTDQTGASIKDFNTLINAMEYTGTASKQHTFTLTAIRTNPTLAELTVDIDVVPITVSLNKAIGALSFTTSQAVAQLSHKVDLDAIFTFDLAHDQYDFSVTNLRGETAQAIAFDPTAQLLTSSTPISALVGEYQLVVTVAEQCASAVAPFAVTVKEDVPVPTEDGNENENSAPLVGLSVLVSAAVVVAATMGMLG